MPSYCWLLGKCVVSLMLCVTAPLSGQAQEPEPADKIAPPAFVLSWGHKGTEPGEFAAPIGIAVNANNEIFVTDARQESVQQFSAAGKLLGRFEAGKFAGAIAIDAQGIIYVASMMDHKISAHRCLPRSADAPPDSLNTFETVRTWGQQGTGDGEFDQPGGLAFGKDGSLYVCDQVNHRVQQFTSEGKFLAKWGQYGAAPGEFGAPETPTNRVGGPCWVAIDADGNVHTTEPTAGRIQTFSPEGKYLGSWGTNEARPGGFGGRPKNMPGPIAIVFDPQGRVWVSATNDRVQCFTAGGEYLCGLGTTGVASDAPAQFHTPHGLALDRDGNFYVVDTQNHRVQKFAK